MLLEADLVRIVGVRFVAVDGLRSVGILDRGLLLWLAVVGRCRVVHAAKVGGGGVAGIDAYGTAGVA